MNNGRQNSGGHAWLSILLVCDTYPPVIGGSEIEAQRVSAALIERGHRVHVLCSGGPPMPAVRDWVDPAGVPVSILTRKSTGRTKDFVFATQVAWTLLWEHRHYDIVYFLMQGLHLASGLPVARALAKPIVMKFGGSGVIPLMRRSRMGRLELDWLRAWAARLMVLNDGMMEEAIVHGFRQEQMLWMPNPVNVAEFRPGAPDEAAALRRKFGIPPGATVCIYVGRLSPEKGLPPLLRGFAVAAGSVPEARLILLGDGAMRAELESLSASLGIQSRIHFAGRVDGSEVPAWLRAADLFSLTSPSEGFSCALAEAMAAGLPSVVTEIAANTQLIDSGVHGILVPFGDDQATGAALTRLFTDEPLRRRMGAASHQRIAENYSTSSVADRYEVLFHQLLEK